MKKNVIEKSAIHHLVKFYCGIVHRDSLGRVWNDC